jgi:hypothetical protein
MQNTGSLSVMFKWLHATSNPGKNNPKLKLINFQVERDL